MQAGGQFIVYVGRSTQEGALPENLKGVLNDVMMMSLDSLLMP